MYCFGNRFNSIIVALKNNIQVKFLFQNSIDPFCNCIIIGTSGLSHTDGDMVLL